MFLKNFKIGQKMFLGFGVITLLMLLILGYTYVNFTKESQSVNWTIHTYDVMREADEISLSLSNMESGARGYALTGKEDFLDIFDLGKEDFTKHYSIIRKLTEDNYHQQDRLASLETNYETWLQWETSQLIDERKKVTSGQKSINDIIAVVQQGKGKSEMDNIRKLVNQIIQEEQTLLETRRHELIQMEEMTRIVLSLGGLLSVALAVIISLLVIRMVVFPVSTVTNTFKEVAEGDVDLEVRLNVNSNDELGDMAKFFNKFMGKLKELMNQNISESWLKAGQAELNEKMRGEQELAALCSSIITFISKYVKAQVGAIYIKTEDGTFKLLSSYSYNRRKNAPSEIRVGEGVVGQAALERQSIILTNVPEDYVKITSGLGEANPRNLLVTPCIYNNAIESIIELGSFKHFSDLELQFIELISSSIAIAIHSTNARIKMKDLLEKTLQQAEELQTQQEELRQNNEELEEQTRALKESEMLLQNQQEELRGSNEELQERSRNLEIQKNEIAIKNESLRNAQVEIEQKAESLVVANKYKSEFLANMSHELRTPLNSILVLSQMLAEKKDSTPLTEKQQEYAKTINSSGKDLLKLINDILDLSKVEAGKMELTFEKLYLSDIVEYVERSFRPIASQKNLEFELKTEKGVPEYIISDMLRVQQIINNLLSNAFKFTHQGKVTMTISPLKNNDIPELKGMNEKYIKIAVSDTGIGIPKDKLETIFEAFKQCDGTISRKYGGTGLGLSISKELACLIGGSIYLKSSVGIGSNFTLILPVENNETDPDSDCTSGGRPSVASQISEIFSKSLEDVKPTTEEVKPQTNGNMLNTMGKSLLIIEDDKDFSSILVDLSQERGYNCSVSHDGKSGLQMAKTLKPDAILLDIGLPDINGWTLLEQLKEEHSTSNIPVHIITGSEVQPVGQKQDDVLSYLRKPVDLVELDGLFKKLETYSSSPLKKMLIVDGSKEEIDNICNILSPKGIQISYANSGKDAYNLIKNEPFDCIILDLQLKDMTGTEFLKQLLEDSSVKIPVIVHTNRELSRDDETELRRYAESIIIKGTKSLDRLSAEVTLFLHGIDSKLEQNKVQSLKLNHEKEDRLKDKEILIIDDDMRNVFALTSALEEKGMKVTIGRNGKEGIKKLQQNPNTNLVIMDVMMPEMDGYTSMTEIRKDERFKNLPIIAITAKAMKEDRQKCIESGADDYLTKPIEIDKLISLLRVWLY